MKSNGCLSLLNILHKNLNKAIIYVNEMITTPFSPFDIKCKKLNLVWKTSGYVFLGHLRGSVFHIFPTLHLIKCVSGWPSIPFRIFVDHVSIFNWSPVQHLSLSSLWRKWLEIVVDSCYIDICLKWYRGGRSDSEIHR